MSRSPFFVALAAGILAAGLAGAQEGEAPLYPKHADLLLVRDASGTERRVRNRADWEVRRGHILANMQKVMGLLPKREGGQGRLFRRPVPLDVQVEEEKDEGEYVRKKLSYVSVPQERVPAFLLVPKGLKAKAPAVLALHQTVKIGKDEPAGLGGNPDLHYGRELAARGYVVLIPDYPRFGDNGIDPYERGWKSASMKAIWDNIRGVDVLATLAEVDPERIGCLGHSLGGHNSLFTAAFDPRIRCVVSNCGFTSFPKYYGGNLAGWAGPAYMPVISTHYPTPDKLPFDFTEVVGALAPRPFLAIAPVGDSNFEVTGVQDVIAAAAPVYALLGTRERLASVYPDVAHQWPLDMRLLGYNWLDRWLKKEAPMPLTTSRVKPTSVPESPKGAR